MILLIYAGICPQTNGIAIQIVKSEIDKVKDKLIVPLNNALKLCDKFNSIEDAVNIYCREEKIPDKIKAQLKVYVL